MMQPADLITYWRNLANGLEREAEILDDDESPEISTVFRAKADQARRCADQLADALGAERKAS